MKKIKITEEQYEYVLGEDVTISADVKATNGDYGEAIKNAKTSAQKAGLNTNDVNYKIEEGIELKVSDILKSKKKRMTEGKNIMTVREFYKKLRG